MKTSKFILIAAATALGLGGFVNSNILAAEDNARPHPRGHLLQNVKERLDLTDDQVARIKAQVKSEKENITPLIERLRVARAGVHEAIRAPGATEASVRAAAAKLGDVEADLAVERLKLYGKISPILTDEQREKIKEFKTQMDQVVGRAIDRAEERLSR